ncbi:HlyD family secretion protein [Henriciella aquimarina]|uniref:HlyD family secretion protein n=1 Tax=Henriciella aquimarina TaxID=545261 RepID=UPI0009FD5177
MFTGIALAIGFLLYAGQLTGQDDTPPGFLSGNGRLEATEIRVAPRIPGRLEEILVKEGDFVEAGSIVAHMDTRTLQAQRLEAVAMLRQAENNVAIAESQIAQRQSELAAAQSALVQRRAEAKAAKARLARTEELSRDGASSAQELDDDQARAESAEAAVAAAVAQVSAARTRVDTSRTEVISAKSSVDAAKATIERIAAEIDDSALDVPRSGRVQYLVAREGEVLGAGSVVLTLVDLSDVYMTFFVPETKAGRIPIGAPVYLVLDAAPQIAVPASVSFVSDVAQFTPKTVETREERQKLMFRVRARVDPALLEQYIEQVKTGLPGEAYLRLDPSASWPEDMPPVIQAD